MAPKERYLIGELSPLIERNDSECATTAGLPIDRKVFWVGLDNKFFVSTRQLDALCEGLR